MPRPILWLVLFIVAAEFGCSSMKVTYDYDPGADFSTYRTFDWVAGPQEPTGDPRIDNQLTDIRIRVTVDGQLTLKGYRRVASEKPDFSTFPIIYASLKDLLNMSSISHYDGFGVETARDRRRAVHDREMADPPHVVGAGGRDHPKMIDPHRRRVGERGEPDLA